MNAFASVVLTMILAFVAKFSPGPVSRIDHDLAARYADDIAVAADGDVEMALALVVTQRAESDFREDVEHCHCKKGECDAGPDGKATAFSGFQLHAMWLRGHTARDVCASNRLAASLAAQALRELKAKRGTWRSAFRAYVGANSESDERLRDRGKQFEQLLREHGGAS